MAHETAREQHPDQYAAVGCLPPKGNADGRQPVLQSRYTIGEQGTLNPLSAGGNYPERPRRQNNQRQ